MRDLPPSARPRLGQERSGRGELRSERSIAVRHSLSTLGRRLASVMGYEQMKMSMVTPEGALPGRSSPIAVVSPHAVLGTSMVPPFPDGFERAIVGLGCFWGAERLFWQLPGVFTTAVGYAGGFTPNPTSQEVCSGLTGQAEVVRVIYDPEKIDYEDLLKAFWE